MESPLGSLGSDLDLKHLLDEAGFTSTPAGSLPLPELDLEQFTAGAVLKSSDRCAEGLTEMPRAG